MTNLDRSMARGQAVSPTTSARGFSLVEMLVVIGMLGLLMIGLTAIFSRSSQLARSQTEQAAMQQALRVSQHEMTRFVRMAGAGGLPITWTTAGAAAGVTENTTGSFPLNGFAMEIDNNSPTGTKIPESADGDFSTHWVIPGSDILTVRGVLTSPVYYLEESLETEGWVDEATSTWEATSSLKVPERAAGFYLQSLAPLVARLEDNKDREIPTAILLRDLGNPNAYVILEWNRDTPFAPGPCESLSVPADWADSPAIFNCVTLGLKAGGSGSPGKDFASLSMGNNLQADAGSFTLTVADDTDDDLGGRDTLQIPKNVGSVGILEEFRFYIRAEWEIPGDTSSRLTPVLTRAEFVPGTDILIERVDVVENMLDLQLAIGIEVQGEIGSAGFANIVDDGTGDDEILFNSPDDDLEDPSVLAALAIKKWHSPELEYHYVRISTLAQAARPSNDSWVPQLATMEDVDRSESFTVDGKTYNYNVDRFYRRGYLQSIVEMRNLK